MSIDVDTAAVPVVTWDDFDSTFQWKQGEHVTIIGANGRGKTTLELAILPRREYIIFFGTKRKDRTQTALTRRMGYQQTADPSQIHADVSKRWLLKPQFPKSASVAQLKKLHAGVFRRALMMAFRQGGWTVVCDEVRYLTDYLGLSDEVELLALQGRSLPTTLVSGSQRPRHIPLEVYSQARHLFFFSTPDGGDVRRIAEIAQVVAEPVVATVPNLPEFHFMYVHPESGTMMVAKSPPPN